VNRDRWPQLANASPIINRLPAVSEVERLEAFREAGRRFEHADTFPIELLAVVLHVDKHGLTALGVLCSTDEWLRAYFRRELNATKGRRRLASRTVRRLPETD
jgi:hypothetical protein